MNSEKLERLGQILRNLNTPLNIACSGGLDSRFLAFAAKYIGIKHINLLHITGVHIDTEESQNLQEWATLHHFPIRNINLDVLANENIRNNLPLRCYHCKHLTFSTMLPFCENNTLCDGTHFDDTKSHRPGLRALQELKISSPLALSGFSKSDIKNLAKEIGLDNPNQKAKPCLLTRFDYDTLITREKLEKVSCAESILLNLLKKEFDQGDFPDFRIREIESNIYEVHSVEIVPSHIIQALQKALEKANIPPIEYKPIKTLSNYFDTNKQPLIKD